MSTNPILTPDIRFRQILAALLTILLGLGMIFFPFRLFSYLVSFLPWGLLLSGAWCIVCARGKKRQRTSRIKWLFLAIILLADGLILYYQTQWRDIVLWYLLAFYWFFSAWQLLQPIWHRGVEKQTLARCLGVLPVFTLALLMLFRPRSGLSDALTLQGIFAVGWGLFQLLLPPHRE